MRKSFWSVKLLISTWHLMPLYRKFLDESRSVYRILICPPFSEIQINSSHAARSPLLYTRCRALLLCTQTIQLTAAVRTFVRKSCTKPEPVIDIVGDEWLRLHKRYVAETNTAEPDVVFIGDSIIQQLQFTTLWTEKINSLHCVNFGIGGDKVQNVLWRLLNGEMNFKVRVKAVVLFVGTNNLGDKPEDIFAGILACVRVIKEKLGDVKIILPTLLPRGKYPNQLRDKNNAVNRLMMETFTENAKPEHKDVYVVPIHENILQSDDTISYHIMHDYLHPTDAAYTKIFGPVYTVLLTLIQK